MPTGRSVLRPRRPMALVALAVAALAVAVVVALRGSGGDRRDGDRETPATDENPTRPGGPPALAAAGTPLPATVDLSHLDPARDVHGTTVDEQGSPVPGARIEVARIEDPFARAATALGSTTSAADGTFAVRLPAALPVVLTATSHGFAPTQRANVRPGVPQRLVLSRGVAWSITVVDPTGAPVPGATVTARVADLRTFTAPLASGMTDAQGRVDFVGLPPRKPAWAVIRHPDYATPTPTPCERMPAAGTLETRIPLDPGHTVDGVCVDAESGAPLAGVRVGLEDPPLAASPTGADGRFTVLHAPRGDTVSLRVEAAGYGSQWRSIDLPGPVEIRLGRPIAVHGRVVRPEGTPVSGVPVTAHGYGPDGGPHETTTSSDGRFRLEGLDHAAEYVVVARPEGGPAVGALVDPPPTGALEANVEDLVLPAGERIVGRVVHADGRPAVGWDVEHTARPRTDSVPIPVRVLERQVGTARTTTADDGGFAFDPVAAGDYVVTASLRGGPQRTTRVSVASEQPPGPVLFTVPALRRIEVHVVDDAGEPVTTARIEPRGGEADGSPILLDDAGHGVAWVEPDTVGFGVTCSGAGAGDRRVFRHEQRFWALPRTSDSIRIVLPRAVLVRGRVLDPDGTPIPRAGIRIVGHDGRYIGGSDGAFSIATNVPDPVTVRFEGEVYGTRDEWTARETDLYAEASGAVRNGEEIVLRARRLEGGRSQSVLVLDPDGRPVEGAQVAYATGDTPWVDEKTDARGQYTATDLQDRAYAWRASANGDGVSAPSEQVVATPSAQVLVLRLRPPRLLKGRVAFPASGRPDEVRVVLRVIRSAGWSQRYVKVEPSDGTFAVEMSSLDGLGGEGDVCVAYAEAGPHERPTHRGPRADVDREHPGEILLTLAPLR